MAFEYHTMTIGLGGIILLIATVILGGSAGFFIRKPNAAYLKLMLSFGGAYVLGISILHLMPEVFGHQDSTIGLWVIGGFFLQLILEQFSQGIEHAHIHARKNATSFFAVQIMIGLCAHAFLEGMPLGVGEIEHAGHTHGPVDGNFIQSLLWGIILHKIPAAFALVLVLRSSGFSKSTSWILLITFALMSPLGSIVGGWIDTSGGSIAQIILAIVLGSFIHIATTILFEIDSSSHHHVSWKKMMAIVLGIGLAILTIF